jgi:hypothetical protein
MILHLLSVLAVSCKIRDKTVEKSKNCKPYFVVLFVTRATTFPKHVYTFEFQFLLEKLKCETPRSMFQQNPYMILNWVLDILWELACLGSVPKFAQSY